MNEKNCLISIIVPVYNCVNYLDETIQSILNQSYPNWEVFFIDDYSSDNSSDVIKKYMESDERINLIRNEKNLGAAASRNRALKEVKGEYICFLDSDDFWMPNKLELQLKFMQENDYLFTYTAYNLCAQNGIDLNRHVDVPEKIDYKGLLKRTVISTITVMAHKSLKNELIMPNVHNGEDMATWLTILKKIPYAHGLNIELSTYRQVSNSLSQGFINKLSRMWKVYRNIEHLSFFYSCYCYVIYLNNVLKKRKVK